MEQAIMQRIGIEFEQLEALARRAAGRADLRLSEWQIKAISGGLEQGSGIQRISGAGISRDTRLDWSMILKIIRPGPHNSAGPRMAHDWRREPQYYRSGILEDLPGGLKAPECYALFERPDGIWLFLEDVHDQFRGSGFPHGWPFDYYPTAARCLGHFNGTYLVGRPLPTEDWIPRQWMRTYIEEAAGAVDLFFQSQEHPFVKRAFRGVSLDFLRSAWEERHAMLDTLDQLPQVFSHQDSFKRNLFARKTSEDCDELVAVDWSYAGPAALGTDLGVLITASMGLGDVPFDHGQRLEEACLAGYLQGLEEVGYHADPDLIRYSYSTGMFWRYTYGAMIGEGIPGALDERSHPMIEQAFGRSMDQIAELVHENLDWNLRYYDQAMRLKPGLGL